MSLSEVRHLARKRPEQEFLLNRIYGVHVSPLLTVVCLRLGLSPDQVTIAGGAVGGLGIALLFLPLGWWSILGVVALQLAFVLDFSDGQVARFTGRTSAAGSYLDWLTHFYLPVGAVLATAASVAWGSGVYAYVVLGAMAALELSAFQFSCKEHVLVALARADPALAASAALQAAYWDDARSADVLAAPPGPAVAVPRTGIPGRLHGHSLRSILGEILIYPGALHLLTVATVVDAVIALPALPISARGILLAAWALAFVYHVPSAARRNHGLIRAVEQRAAEQHAGEEQAGEEHPAAPHTGAHAREQRAVAPHTGEIGDPSASSPSPR